MTFLLFCHFLVLMLFRLVSAKPFPYEFSLLARRTYPLFSLQQDDIGVIDPLFFPTTTTTTAAPVTRRPFSYLMSYPFWYLPYSSRRAVVEVLGPSTVRGKIAFTQMGPFLPVSITGFISGLSPGNHAWHIHEFGDTLNGCPGTGDHFDPDGSPVYSNFHMGDLGEIVADEQGIAQVTLQNRALSLSGVDSVIGRALVIHQKPDAVGGEETALNSVSFGDEDRMLACGVIGVAKPY